MRFKLDENLGQRGCSLLRAAGHDVATTHDERLSGATDSQLIDHSRSESRCLITLDLDFANPLRFPPERYAGIVALRPPARPTLVHLEACMQTLIRVLERRNPGGRLWVVEIDRVREHESD